MRVSFHNPSDGPEPEDTASVTSPGLRESFTGAAGLFETAAGLFETAEDVAAVFVGFDESGFALTFFVSDEELFEAGRFLGALADWGVCPQVLRWLS